MIRTLRRFASDKGGFAAIEMAFILPFLLLLFFGLVDLTALISLNRKVTYSSSVVADLVTQNNNTVAANDITDYFNAASMIMSPTPVSNVRVEVYQFHKSGSSITSQWNKKSTGGVSCGSTPSTAGMADLMTDGNDLIVARVCTTFTPYVATFLGENILGATTFNIEEEIALRPRQSATLACSGC